MKIVQPLKKILISSLLTNTVLAELLSYSHKQVTTEVSKKRKAWADKTEAWDTQQKEASLEKSKERTQSIETRKAWKEYLKESSMNYLGNNEILEEISRIKEIVSYSSYFRTEESIETLTKLKGNPGESQIFIILKQIK